TPFSHLLSLHDALPISVPCRPVSIRSWLSREFVRVGIHTYAFAVLTLGANFVSGVVTARALAPAGRGQAVAIAMLIQNIAFIFRSEEHTSELQSPDHLV